MEKSLLAAVAVMNLLLAGCGVSSSSSGIPNNIDAFTESAGSHFTESSRDQIIGSGTIVFNEPLTPSRNQGVHLNIDLTETGSYAILVMRSTHSDLADGVRFKISRLSSTLVLRGTLEASQTGTTYQIQDSSLSTYDPYNFDVYVDFVNQALSGLRFLLYRSDNTSFTALSADVDTHSGSHFQPSWPTTIEPDGTFWGLILSGATLKGCRLDSARFSGEN